MTSIAILNESTVITNDQLMPIIAALQIQVTRDVAKFWPEAANVTVAFSAVQTAGWQLVVLDDSDQAGDLGYHDMTAMGQPLGKVFAKTDQQYGEELSVTISHELIEMIVDPWINISVLNAAGDTLYIREACDACQDDSFAYGINGVKVSDFVTPHWFSETLMGGEKFDFGGHIQKPFQVIKGGYIGYLKTENTNGWQILQGEGLPRQMGKAYESKSRFQRVRRPRESWKRSVTR